jgi:hypothetical protein
LVTIEFQIATPRDPHLEPQSPETRHLGIGLMQLTIAAAH